MHQKSAIEVGGRLYILENVLKKWKIRKCFKTSIMEKLTQNNFMFE